MSKYSFDNFYLNKNNREAFLAARSVVDHLGKTANPLYIYGDTQTGKTHILHAIEQYLQKSYSDLRVVRIRTKDFIDDLIFAIRSSARQEFREKYRTADVLLVDDIHYLAGKDASTEEFISVFNAVFETGGQIVVTGHDSIPGLRKIGVSEMLVSRLEWGRAVEIPSDMLYLNAACKNRDIQILYVHGYLGTGYGHSWSLLCDELDLSKIPYHLDAPDFPLTNTDKMKEKLNKLISRNHYDVIVASSLGAFYAMQIPDIPKIMINVALPDNLMRIKALCTEQNQKLTPDFLESIDNVKSEFFSKTFDADLRKQTFLIYGTEDKTAANEDILSKYYDDQSKVYHIEMGHKLDKNGARKVVELITELASTNNP